MNPVCIHEKGKKRQGRKIETFRYSLVIQLVEIKQNKLWTWLKEIF
jgi:hypothetical protein